MGYGGYRAIPKGPFICFMVGTPVILGCIVITAITLITVGITLTIIGHFDNRMINDSPYILINLCNTSGVSYDLALQTGSCPGIGSISVTINTPPLKHGEKYTLSILRPQLKNEVNLTVAISTDKGQILAPTTLYFSATTTTIVYLII